MSEIRRPPLEQETKQQFAGIMVLDRMIGSQDRIHASLMERDDKLLDDSLNILQDKGLVEIDNENFYIPTERGQKLYQTVLGQQMSYTTHFDIYSHVDLGEGVFANKLQHFLDDPRWEDLRVAVSEYKKVDPYRMVFLAMMSAGAFYENPDWKFDLSMGTLFDEMEEIVQSQILIDELAYEDEEGVISGGDVIVDIIEQGALLNKERYEAQAQQETEARAMQRYRDDDDDEVVVVHHGHPGGYYDPMATVGAYAASVVFVETMWHYPYW